MVTPTILYEGNGGTADAAITGTRKEKVIDGTILLNKKVHTHTQNNNDVSKLHRCQFQRAKYGSIRLSIK